MRPGRIFLRRLISLSTTVDKLHHHLCLTKETRADIKWWIDFLPHWNRKSITPETFYLTSSDIKLFTDASSLGFGAIYSNSWIQGCWGPQFDNLSIYYKELFAIVAAVLTWGAQWQGKRIIFFTQIWNSGTTPSAPIMSLIRKMYL